MIKIYDKSVNINEVLNRDIVDYGEYEAVVDEIINNVKLNKDRALKEYTYKFDGVKLNSIIVSEEEIKEAYENIDKNYLNILKNSAKNIEEFHKKQIKNGFEFERGTSILGQKYTPIEKVGIYVPGGTASYPSTVLMNAIPAKIAGVKKIVMATPVQKNGKIKPEILVSALIAGVNVIYKIGGSQAIAAMAFGTESVEKVDKIVGPGNIFVALAKRKVFGIVGIDTIAGPSEILIIADKDANEKFIASDLLSQAEHDKLATAVLVTDSKELALKVQVEVENQLSKLEREDIARISIDNNAKIIVVNSIEEGVKISNLIAPEHLEVLVKEPKLYLDKILNAGSIFLGEYSPEPLGDYYAGPNHTLPTSGNARFSSPLSVDDFVKKSSYIMYSKEDLFKIKDEVITFARSEGLTAHANSIIKRFENE